MSIEEDYRHLMNKIAAKRAVERTLLFFVALCVAGIATALFFQDRSLTTSIKYQQQEARAQSAYINASQKALKAQSADIKAYIQCIAEFFAQPDRATLTLTNLQDCQFNTATFSVGGAATGTAATPASIAVVPPKPQTTVATTQQPTTSAPPPEPTPSSSQPAAPYKPQPVAPESPLERILQPAGDVLSALVNALGL